MPKGRKLSFEAVAAEFESHGCKLLATEYHNNATPMAFICSCGKQSEIMLERSRKSGCCWKS